MVPRAVETVEPLVKVMRDPTDGRPGRRDAQLNAARVLASLDPLIEKTVPLIREARLSDYALIRVEATAALIRHGDAGTPLDQLLGARTDTYDPEKSYPVLPHWLDAIESLGPRGARAVPLLVALLADPIDQYDEDYRWRAARVLGAIGPAARAALPRLRVLSGGGDPTSGLAAEAVRRIEGRVPGRDAKAVYHPRKSRARSPNRAMCRHAHSVVAHVSRTLHWFLSHLRQRPHSRGADQILTACAW